MSDSVRPHRRQPTRLSRPWDSPGKNTGAGCHFLLQCMKVKSESEVAQSCPTLSDPMDCSLPGSSVHGIFPGNSTGVGCHCLLHLVPRPGIKLVSPALQDEFFTGKPGKSPKLLSLTDRISLGQKPHPVIIHPIPLQYSCLEKSHGRRSLVGCSPWGH